MTPEDLAIIHRDRQPPTTPTSSPTTPTHISVGVLAQDWKVSDRTIQRWCTAIAAEMGMTLISPFTIEQAEFLKQVWMTCGENWQDFKEQTQCDRRLTIKQFCNRLREQMRGEGSKQPNALPTMGTVDHLEVEDQFFDLLDSGDPLQAIASEVNAITQQEATIADALVQYFDPAQRRARILAMAAKKMQGAIGGSAPKQLGGS